MSFWRRKTKRLRCPIIEAPCIEAKCMWWQNVKGKDPQSHELIDQWNCAVVWHNVLLVENSQLSNQTVASLQSQRNEMVAGLQGIVETLNTLRKP